MSNYFAFLIILSSNINYALITISSMKHQTSTVKTFKSFDARLLGPKLIERYATGLRYLEFLKAPNYH
jgi:hypothetical protein